MRFVLPILFAMTAAAGPVVLEEGFEGKALPPEWHFAVARGECTGRWDGENAFQSRHSLRIAIQKDASARGHWRYTPRIPLKPDTNYRLSFRQLVLNVTGEGYAILYENGEEVPDHWHVTRKVLGSHDWEEQSILFKTRPDTSWARLILKLRHGTGYTWFDDVKLEESDLGPQEAPGVRQFPPDDGFPLQAMWSPAQWTQQGVLHVARGELNPLSVFFRGAPAALDRPALVIATTPALTVTGTLFRGRGPASDAVPALPDGAQCWRFALTKEALTRAALSDRYRWEQYFQVGLDVSAAAPATGQFTWWFENGGKAGPKHTMPVQMHDLGKPLAPTPDFRILIQHTGILRSPDLAENVGMFRYLQLGAVEGGLAPSHYDPTLRDTDLALAKLGFTSHSWRFEGFDASPALGPRAVDATGKKLARKICPSAQLALPAWRESLQAYYRKRLAGGLRRLIIDYEPPASTVCFCPVCRRAFAEQNGLHVAKILALPGEELRKMYRAAWGAFCAKRHGEIVHLHCQIIREIVPGAEAGLCSWPGTEAIAMNGGDIRQFEHDATFHMPMIYCKGLRYHDQVAETCARTTIPVLPFIELSDISQPRHLTPDELCMNVLATGLSGGGGAVLWVGCECLDAQYLASLRQALAELHDLRGWVPWRKAPVTWASVRPAVELARTIQVDGKPMPIVASDVHPYLRPHVWGDEKRAVAAVFNYDPEKAYNVIIRNGTTERTVPVPAGALSVWKLSREP